MKKWIAMLLMVALMLGCAACSSAEEGLDDIIEDVGEQLNKEISRGTINGNVYTSEFAGVTFTKPDSWIYATDEEIAATMSIGVDSLTDMNAYQETVAKLSTVYDMMVSDAATGTNISLMYENLALTGNSGMSEESYIEALKAQIETLTDMEYTFNDTTTMVVLSGEVYRCMTSYVTVGGIQMQQNYYVRSLDDYMCGIIVTLVGGTPAEDVEAMFS